MEYDCFGLADYRTMSRPCAQCSSTQNRTQASLPPWKADSSTPLYRLVKRVTCKPSTEGYRNMIGQRRFRAGRRRYYERFERASKMNLISPDSRLCCLRFAILPHASMTWKTRRIECGLSKGSCCEANTQDQYSSSHARARKASSSSPKLSSDEAACLLVAFAGLVERTTCCCLAIAGGRNGADGPTVCDGEGTN